MAFASISGLVSGLDSASIVSQLMQVEAMPQTMLKSRVTAEQKAITALQALNTKLAALATKAEELSKAASWSPLKATSSSEHVVATASSSAAAGTLSITVVETAQAHRLSFAASAAMDTRVTTAGSTVVHLTRSDNSVVAVDTGDGTLNGLVQGINSADLGVRATTVRLDDGTFRLHVQSTTTGVASEFGLTNADGTDLLGGAVVATAARDAAIIIGTDTIHSATNSFTGAVTGIDLTIAATTPANTAVEITVARDSEAVNKSMKALVDAANAALADIDELAGYNVAAKKAGTLVGDSTLRTLRNDLLATVTSAADGTSLAGIGVELDRSGRISFDEAKFATAYANDPASVTVRLAGGATWAGGGQATMVATTWRTAPGAHTIDSAAGTIDGVAATLTGGLMTGARGTSAEGLTVAVAGTASGTLTVSPGFAARLAAVAQRASDSQIGTVTSALKGRSSSVKDMEDAIAGWDVRLDLRRQMLSRQFSAMEVALGQLQSQSSWLAGQISSLPKISS